MTENELPMESDKQGLKEDMSQHCTATLESKPITGYLLLKVTKTYYHHNSLKHLLEVFCENEKVQFIFLDSPYHENIFYQVVYHSQIPLLKRLRGLHDKSSKKKLDQPSAVTVLSLTILFFNFTFSLSRVSFSWVYDICCLYYHRILERKMLKLIKFHLEDLSITIER